MNNTSLATLENEREEFLKKYQLDSDSIKAFKEKIKIVPKEQADELGQQLFDLIAKKGFNDDFEKALDLIYNGANLEYKKEPKGDFALIVCARKNYLKTCIVLLRAGANVNQVNNYFTPPVMSSARHGNIEMLEILIMMGANVNQRCLDGDTALFSAKRHNEVACFNMLVDASAHLTNTNILNQTIMDIPSTEAYDLSNFPTSLTGAKVHNITVSDTKSAIEEATKELKKYKV